MTTNLSKDSDLPELPELDGWIGACDINPDAGVEGYTADSMRDYARKAIAAQIAQAVPKGWKPVPFDPTPEMVDAAEDAHMPFGDMHLAIMMAINAAPPTQAIAVEAWQPIETAPDTGKFVAMDENGDNIDLVERYDSPFNRGSRTTVINRFTGKWFTAKYWSVSPIAAPSQGAKQ